MAADTRVGDLRGEGVAVLAYRPLGPGDELLSENDAVVVHVLGQHDELVVLLGWYLSNGGGREDEPRMRLAIACGLVEEPGGQVHGHRLG